MGCLEDNDVSNRLASIINNNGATAPGSEPQPIHLMASQHPGYCQGKA